MVAFLEGNSKSGFARLYTRSHSIMINHQLWAPHRNGGGGRHRKVQFVEIRSSVTWTLTLDRVKVTLVHMSGRGLPTHQIRSKYFLWSEIRTDGRTHLSSGSLFCMAMTWKW